MRHFLHRHLSDRLVKRPKGYFVFKKKTLLRARGFSILDQFVSHDKLLKHGMVNPRVANDYIRRYKMGDEFLEDKVWGLFLFHCWLDTKAGRISSV
jgi:hypothetical protein